jgi:hypothetical protein
MYKPSAKFQYNQHQKKTDAFRLAFNQRNNCLRKGSKVKRQKPMAVAADSISAFGKKVY